MRAYPPQFEPRIPALSQTQVGSASTLVANVGVLAHEAAQEVRADVAAERVLLAAFGGVTTAGATYEQLRPAYYLGWQAAVENPAMGWDVLQRYLPAHWEVLPQAQQWTWLAVQPVVHAAWELALAQPLDAQARGAQQERIDTVDALITPLVQECMGVVGDVQALLHTQMPAFPLQVLQRHVQLLQGFTQELQWLANGVEVARPPRLGWWLRQRSAWLRLQGHVGDWQYRDIMQLCEQREQQLLCSYRSATTDTHSQVVRQVLQHQKHDLQRNMEKLCWVRTYWVG